MIGTDHMGVVNEHGENRQENERDHEHDD